MKETGMTRQIDELGRIVIPKEIRRTLEINRSDYMEIFCDKDSIVLKKYSKACVFCGSRDELIEFNEKTLCKNCAANIGGLAK